MSHPISIILKALLVTFSLAALCDRAIDAFTPHFARLRYNFSATYLRREAHALASTRPIVILGDSVLWGFGVDEASTAASIVGRRHSSVHNFAYAGGSSANTLAMVRFLLSEQVRPSLLIFNINQKQFNPEDSSYRKLYPAVEEVAWPLLTVAERSDLERTTSDDANSRLDRRIAGAWHLYGMRTDLRDAIFRASDAAHALETQLATWSGTKSAEDRAHIPTAARFEGVYDLSPLTARNFADRQLDSLLGLLNKERIHAVAILTPTNHRLLHTYIDAPQYDNNLRYLKQKLEATNVRVIDLDKAFDSVDFLDNDHLTVSGNAHLADALESAF